MARLPELDYVIDLYKTSSDKPYHRWSLEITAEQLQYCYTKYGTSKFGLTVQQRYEYNPVNNVWTRKRKTIYEPINNTLHIVSIAIVKPLVKAETVIDTKKLISKEEALKILAASTTLATSKSATSSAFTNAALSAGIANSLMASPPQPNRTEETYWGTTSQINHTSNRIYYVSSCTCDICIGARIRDTLNILNRRISPRSDVNIAVNTLAAYNGLSSDQKSAFTITRVQALIRLLEQDTAVFSQQQVSWIMDFAHEIVRLRENREFPYTLTRVLTNEDR